MGPLIWSLESWRDSCAASPGYTIRQHGRRRPFKASAFGCAHPSRSPVLVGPNGSSRLEDRDYLTLGDDVSLADEELDQRAGDGCGDRDFHLHQLDRQDQLVARDALALAALDLRNGSAGFCFHDLPCHARGPGDYGAASVLTSTPA